MENTRVQEYDTKLHLALYGYPKAGNVQKIWEELLLEKGDNRLLRQAIKPIMNKEGEVMVQAPTICDYILKKSKEVDKAIYQELVDWIYTFPTIARTKAGKVFCKSNSSFLVQTLQNHDLALDEMQKFVAVTEALSMPSAIHCVDSDSKKHNMSQIYGSTPFDIRYEILMNPNWTIEEKANLVYDFYEKEEDFKQAISAWEKNIINNSSFYSQNGFEAMNQDKLYYYTEEEISKYYREKDQNKKIREEIRLCELFHQIRPQKEMIENQGEKIFQKK